VIDIGESVVISYPGRPAFHGSTFDLLGASAHPADQMVMVWSGLATKPVQRLTLRGLQYVGISGVGQGLQVPIYGRQPDRLSLTAQLGEDGLRAAEALSRP
jgi:hypothetical protein